MAAGADHAGWELKQLLVGRLAELGHDVSDLGTDGPDPVDYPDFGAAVGREVATGRVDLGLCVCGSGIGIAIAANKVAGVRAATVHDVTSARMARRHNDANVVCLGARFVGSQTALDAVEAFMEATFDGGRHEPRVAKLNQLDQD